MWQGFNASVLSISYKLPAQNLNSRSSIGMLRIAEYSKQPSKFILFKTVPTFGNQKVYAALKTSWTHIWNENMYLHYSEKSVHWPEIWTSKVRGPISNNSGKKIKLYSNVSIFSYASSRVHKIYLTKIFLSQKNIIPSQNTISSY